MPEGTRHTFNESDFNSLLEQTLLNLDFDDPKNAGILDGISNSILNSDNVIHSNKTNTLKKIFQKINLNSFIIFSIVAIISIIGIFSFYTVNDKVTGTTPAPANLNSNPKLPDPVNQGPLARAISIPDKHPVKTILNRKERDMVIIKDCTNVTKAEEPYLPKYTEPLVFNTISIDVQKMDDSTYIFPKLTEKEIKANNKQRKKMLEQLLKLTKSRYSLIPKGIANDKAESKILETFYMQNYEISNLEYRTFLFDLLIQNKKGAFLKAKPNQALWINSNGSDVFDSFKDEYFSNKKFNEYPVVTISVEGAKLYCEWFNELINTNSNVKTESKQNVTIRLPKESEWIYSAMGGFKQAVYPWGRDSIQNSINLFLANFCVQKLTDKFKQPINYGYKINLNAYTSGGLATNTDTMATVLVNAYNPNDYGLYCMSGNVAEWVISEDAKTVKALGGSWGSDFEHLKLNSESEFKGKTSSPFIGFRPIVIIKK